ncbi:MAG: ion channel [Myxococcota bacterium]
MQSRERIHSAFLFPAVVTLLIVQPVLAAFSIRSEFLVFPLAVTLLASIWSVDRHGLWFRVGLGLALVLLVSGILHARNPSPRLIVATFGGFAVLSAMSVVLGVRWLFASAQITVATLLSAVSVYLLIGATFGLTYVAIYLLDPSAFSGVSPAGRSAETAELIYYSIGTLSTSAFGDVLPTHPVTRLLANVESVTGQLYMAVLVAILITGYASGSQRS